MKIVYKDKDVATKERRYSYLLIRVGEMHKELEKHQKELRAIEDWFDAREHATNIEKGMVV